jgi:hypothetical protein
VLVRNCAAALAVAAGVVVLGGGAAAAPGDLALASTTASGVKSNGDSGSTYASLSADGNVVAFDSHGTNLDPLDRESGQDVYVKTLSTGQIAFVPVTSSGVKGNGVSWDAEVSADGRVVAFSATATNLVPGDKDSFPDAYVKDLSSGDVKVVSTSSSGTKGNGGSYPASTSADGSRVAFFSDSSNLDRGDTDTELDLYVKDTRTNELILASTPSSGVKGANEVYLDRAILSADGSSVAFTWAGPGAGGPYSRAYVKDLATGSLTVASRSASGADANGDSYVWGFSGDGSRVAFYSHATNLDPADTDSALDVYVKDLRTGEVTLASTTADAVKGNGDSYGGTLSGDGTKLGFFSEATNLDPRDVDRLEDVYVKDLRTGALTLSSTSSTGEKGNGHSDLAAVSGDGSRVVFRSRATNLDSRDTNTDYDVYVKEVPPEVCTRIGSTLSITVPSAGSVSIGRSGTSFNVAAAGLPDSTCGGSTVDNTTKVDISGRVHDDALTVDLSNGPFAPSAGGSEIPFRIDLGAGSDRLTLQGGTDAERFTAGTRGINTDLDADVDLTLVGVEQVTLDGGDGNDVLSGLGGRGTGLPFPATLTLRGAGGDDQLVDGAGADVEDGGPGNDRFTAGKAASGGDVLNGGPGSDTADYAARTVELSVTLDGSANDGAAGESDNVAADVERVIGGSGDDTIDAGLAVAVANMFSGGPGADTLLGRGGNDMLNVADGVSGNDFADGGSGTDRCARDGGDVAFHCER